MSSEYLRSWQKRMGYTYDTASKALMVSRRTYAGWLSGDYPIEARTLFACAAIEHLDLEKIFPIKPLPKKNN